METLRAVPTTLRLRVAQNPQVGLYIRILFFIIALAIACPIRYWPIAEDFDNSWVFGLNYAAAHGLMHGRDVVFNTGPLGHLVFAQDVGNNLRHAIQFQLVVWATMSLILWDLFFRVNIPLRNLCLFTGLFALSAPLFWFNRIGIDNLLLSGALVFFVVYRWRGGVWRFVTALALIGVMPLIKLTSPMIAIAALVGFLVEGAIRHRWSVWRDVALAVVVPSLVAGVGFWLTIPSFPAFSVFVRAAAETSAGYSEAMSVRGPTLELLAAGEALVLISALLFIQAKAGQLPSRFWIFVLAIPIAVSFKHGFVRQDLHVINFFCFCSLALALILLTSELHGRHLLGVTAILLPFLVIWQTCVLPTMEFRTTVGIVTGLRGLRLAWNARNLSNLQAALLEKAKANYNAHLKIEPALREVIGDATVTSISWSYSGAVVVERLNFSIYPLVTRAAAYTPYLDDLCAKWVRDQGPRFIVFDGRSMDGRHPWAETPAMWLEVYRWYNTRMLGKDNLLLERRAQPRFSSLAPLQQFAINFRAGFSLPESPDGVFWAMSCRLSLTGKLEKLFFRVPVFTMQVQRLDGERKNFRVLAEVLRNPVMGTALPATLPQFADVFRDGAWPKPTVRHLSFGERLSPSELVDGEFRSYEPSCTVELFQPVI